MDRAQMAAEAFRRGYNCAQAVAVAYCDLLGMTEAQAARMACSFGGGMGRLREVCGGVSGMLLAAGLLYGYDDPGDEEGKKRHYALVQRLAGRFRQEAGSIVCREILKDPPSDPNPTPRTADFYEKRPCLGMVSLGARILEDYIRENPIP